LSLSSGFLREHIEPEQILEQELGETRVDLNLLALYGEAVSLVV